MAAPERLKADLFTCRECYKKVTVIAKKIEISIRTAGTAIEIVADDVCLDCLRESIKQG